MPIVPTIVSSLVTTTSGRNETGRSAPCTPATTTRPPGAASSTAWRKASGASAVMSTTTSAPRPVASWSARTGSSVATSTARSAPNARAAASRSASRGPWPVIMTKPAPTCVAARTPASPGRPARGWPPSRRPEAADLGHPFEPGAERVEHRRHDRVDAGRDRQQHRVRGQVVVGGVATPQSRGPVDGDEAVHLPRAMVLAVLVVTGGARRAPAARLEDLHRHPVAGGYSPPGRRRLADGLDDADRLVARHEPVRRPRQAGRRTARGPCRTAHTPRPAAPPRRLRSSGPGARPPKAGSARPAPAPSPSPSARPLAHPAIAPNPAPEFSKVFYTLVGRCQASTVGPGRVAEADQPAGPGPGWGPGNGS